jgi:hypothetical protein
MRDVQKTSIKEGGNHRSACHLQLDFLLDLFFDPEDGGKMFLRNDGRISTDYTALYPRL